MRLLTLRYHRAGGFFDAKTAKTRVRAHALATQRLLRDPDAGFELAIEEAKRVVALTGAPQDGP